MEVGIRANLRFWTSDTPSHEKEILRFGFCYKATCLGLGAHFFPHNHSTCRPSMLCDHNKTQLHASIALAVPGDMQPSGSDEHWLFLVRILLYCYLVLSTACALYVTYLDYL